MCLEEEKGTSFFCKRERRKRSANECHGWVSLFAAVVLGTKDFIYIAVHIQHTHLLVKVIEINYKKEATNSE
jgi:hypothetical protein